MLVVASVLGIWGAMTGSGGRAPDPLPSWSLDADGVHALPPESDPVWPIAPLPAAFDPPEDEVPPFTPGEADLLPFFSGPETLPPLVRVLPPADEPELSSTELAFAHLRRLRDEPRFFPGLMRTLLLPVNLAVEGVGWLLLPHSITINGQTLFDRDASSEDFATIFVRTLVEREIKFLAGLSSTYVATFNVELGLKDYDPQLFNRLQSRVIFDSLKRAYRERYHVPALDLDTLVSTFSTGEWVDFLVVPAVVSVYAARYGIDRKWQVCDGLRIQLHLEKGDRFYKFATENHGGQIGAVAVNLFKLPVSFIFQADRGSRQFVDPAFIGIGTDLSVVVQALNGARYGE